MSEIINILHIINDEKFIPYCKETFTKYNIKNTFSSIIEFENNIKTKSFQIIIIHYLNNENAYILNRNYFRIPIIWFFWGGDGFLLGKFSNSFLLPITKSLFIRHTFQESFLLGIKTIFKSMFPSWVDRLPNNREVIRSFKKIDYIVPVMPRDYDLLKKKYTIQAPMFHLNYINPILNDFINKQDSGRNILLGNSASYSNNHIEMISILSKIDLEDRQVIIPLSYGDKKYGKYISDFAIKKLGKKAICMLEFIPFEDYFRILEGCSIVFMNHLRQQAVGNIVPMLAKGSHIYLRSESSLYQFLQEKKFIITSIEESNTIRELTIEEKTNNKRLCIEYFGKESIYRKVDILLENILGREHEH